MRTDAGYHDALLAGSAVRTRHERPVAYPPWKATAAVAVPRSIRPGVGSVHRDPPNSSQKSAWRLARTRVQPLRPRSRGLKSDGIDADQTQPPRTGAGVRRGDVLTLAAGIGVAETAIYVMVALLLVVAAVCTLAGTVVDVVEGSGKRRIAGTPASSCSTGCCCSSSSPSCSTHCAR